MDNASEGENDMEDWIVIRIAVAVAVVVIMVVVALFKYQKPENNDTPMRRFIDKWNRRI